MDSDAIGRRLVELAQRADIRGEVVFGRFLDPAQQALAIQLVRQTGTAIAFWGGYEDAERRIAAFYPSGMLDESDIAGLDWPLSCVRVSWAAAYGSPAHRDLLGASLAIIQDRSRFGDIVMGDGFALLFCLRELAEHIILSLEQAGRVTVRCAVEPDPPSAMPDESESLRETRDTIPSFRLDACVASAFNLSRSQAQDLIREGKARRNHLPAPDVDILLKQGDMISVRGMGRAILSETLGVNRKGRFGVKWICTPTVKKRGG